MATIQSYTNTFKVPFVTFSMAQNTSSNTSFQIYMRPIYVNALVAVISHYGWDKVYYIYDSDEGNDCHFLVDFPNLLFRETRGHAMFKIMTGQYCNILIVLLGKGLMFSIYLFFWFISWLSFF